MAKLDLRKENKYLYAPSAKEASLVVVPPQRFLMIDGEGDPNSADSYKEALNVLFSVSYSAKFMVRKRPGGIDYAVMPLEGLWWSDDMRDFPNAGKSKWKWTAMIAQPDFVDEMTVNEAIRQTKEKKGIAGTERLRFELFDEGRCAQILHIGPFTTEGPTVENLHKFIEKKCLTPQGKHHEIYLGDFRKTAPERLKTVIRQPVA